MIQEVRHEHEQRRLAERKTVVADGRRQMGLPGAIAAHDHEPPGRLLGELAGPLIGGPLGSIHHKGAERIRGHGPEVALLHQALGPPLRNLALPAFAANQLTEPRIIHGHVETKEPGPVAARTGWCFRTRRGGRTARRCISLNRDAFENVADRFQRTSPRFPTASVYLPRTANYAYCTQPRAAWPPRSTPAGRRAPRRASHRPRVG